MSITYAGCIAVRCQFHKLLEDFSLQSVRSPCVLKECICMFVCVMCLKAVAKTLATFSHKMSETCTAGSLGKLRIFIYNTALMCYRESRKALNNNWGGVLIAVDQGHLLP